MTLNSSVERWLKVIGLILAITTVLIFISWVGGSVFMAWIGYKFDDGNAITLYRYWRFYGDDPAIQRKIGWSLLIGLVVTVVPIIAIALTPRRKHLFGNAKLASMNDIRKAGLLEGEGIILGEKRYFFGIFRKFLMLSGTTHACLAAPTRSGKGVSVVVPNLLTWPDSVVVLDMKGENWDITAGYRSYHGQDCYLVNFAPRSLKTWSWNPLHYISDDPNFRINDIQKIGHMLFPTMEQESPIWQASSRSLWVGLVLYLLETEGLPVSIGEVYRQISMGDEHLINIIEQRKESDNPLSEECYLALFDYLQTPERTRGGIRKSFISALELFQNPVINAATSKNDFDLRDLRKKRMSVYLAVPPDDLQRLQPLINLFMQQVIDLNTRDLPENDPDLKYKCLILGDEFKAFGRLPSLADGISYIAGYNLRLLTIVQSPAQIRSVYGADDAETFLDNQAAQIVYAPKNIKIAKEISDSIGTMTVKSVSRTKQLFWRSGESESASETGRAVLLPQEVRDIGKKSALLFIENCRPILCRKIIWYADKVFASRGNNLAKNKINYPCPEPPTITIAEKKGDIDYSGLEALKQKDKPKEQIIERPITEQDLENLDDLDLSDFSIDFSDIEVPKSKIGDEELHVLMTDVFMEKLKV